MITKVTSDEFTGLVNPYTGKPMTVMMNVTANGVMFFAPDTYSTSDRLSTAEECYRKWNRVNDIEGGRAGRPIVCAYTGETLSLVRSPLGCYYHGGFDPHMFHSREDFLYYATMRGGVAKRPKPSKSSRVQAPARTAQVTENARKHAEANAPKLDEDRIHMVEKSLKPFKDLVGGSSAVSMSTAKKHGRK